jgi:hypothetical protein
MRITEFDRAHEGIVYRDLRLFMNLSFNSFEFSHVPRTCNKLAHELAAYGATRLDTELLWPESTRLDTELLWPESLPSDVLYLFGWTAYLLFQVVNEINVFLLKKRKKENPNVILSRPSRPSPAS